MATDRAYPAAPPYLVHHTPDTAKLQYFDNVRLKNDFLFPDNSPTAHLKRLPKTGILLYGQDQWHPYKQSGSVLNPFAKP